ncbi:MAG TPA: hypothetical protein VFC90_10870 [Planctomycetota bacterium]|nr:hypothetical protein [Planctomycetota bacterium]
MRNAIAILSILALLACIPATASAQDGGKRKHGKRHEALLKKFDKDGDGQLSEQERAAAKEFKAQRRGEEGRGGKLREKVLRRFDKDGDHKLNDGEREALKKFLESPRARGGRKGRR